ncbi:hypothetical protein BC936DRAFT_139444 [Jimgerdemannia flammicorona]|uniref:SKP1 component POZ domain-containing protein n=1 Tax=Jimgerdemannia flammicorona TaxID=994334 RepID=A0A433B9W6_9FUNG|nr:hypothetical protein BC936DRAFT_139444 [Jimgerdemannia flammicorona]
MANNSDQQQNPEALEFVKLISCDGFEFIVNKEVALRSGTIKNMLSSPGPSSSKTFAAIYTTTGRTLTPPPRSPSSK